MEVALTINNSLGCPRGGFSSFFGLCGRAGLSSWLLIFDSRFAAQEKQSKSEHEALLNRMCELEQMVDDAGGAMDDIAVS